MDMIGKTISHYQILEKLGEGGMGVVYKAEDTKLKRAVALKFLPHEALANRESKARLLREAQAVAALDHPNVCTVFEIDQAEEKTFIVMALIEGRTLKERIGEGPLPLADALDIAIQTAEGLHHAHGKGVVHRDIKPSNLMVSGDGQVKILDFGLARSAGQTQLTRAGTTLGTVAYMSPEQARGEQVDCRTDVWSLGIVLFEMITGRLPFAGEHEQAVIYAIRTEEPEPLTGIRSGVPLDLDRVVAKYLAKDPEERYQTIADLLADLRRIQRTSGATAKVTSVAPAPRLAWLARRKRLRFAGVLILVLLAGFILSRALLPPGGEPEGRKMLAVLPLENLGPAEDEYFADGLTEEITSRLAGLNGLGVISRTSTMRYKSDRPNLKQIGQELGVDYVLEGTVRWERRQDGASRVLVTPQLIRVADDTHLWTDRYLRDLAEIFAVQADIAREVARELNVTLLDREQATLDVQPTENLQAYEAYLRGLEALKNPNSREEDFLQAEREFELAVEMDPAFTMAHVRLSEAHCELVFWGYDRSEARQQRAEAALEKALALAPDLPEVHRELGSYYYMVHHDFDRALAEFAIAERGLPNDPELMESVAYIRRRQGLFEEAIGHLHRAASLDPRNAWLRMQLGYSHTCVRMYAKADRCFERSIALEADQIIVYGFKAFNHVLWDGDFEQARNVITAAPNQQDPLIVTFWYWVELWSRDFQAAIGRLADLSSGIAGAASWVIVKDLLAGHAYHALGDHDQAVASFTAALPILEQLVREQPQEAEFHGALGEAYAGLGRKEDAIREGEAAVELARNDALKLCNRYVDLAQILVMLGEFDAAIDTLDIALSMPGIISVELLRLSTLADPLRDHPRYQQVIQKYSRE